MKVAKIHIFGVLALIAIIGYAALDGWFAPRIEIPNPRRIDPSKEIEILDAIQSISEDFTNRKWDPFHVDVTNDLRDVIKDTSFSDILNDFADLDGRDPVIFNPDRFENGKIYYLGVHPSALSRLPIKNSNFCRSCELIISVKYIDYDKYEFQSARILSRQAWP
ncbi:hypothetical protein V5F79_08285 [Xanthobacter flavus]|uniref:hypothetical protein n=1 Tax=Xanthobacter flavus TaxID=281 RepID=UPI003728F76C